MLYSANVALCGALLFAIGEARIAFTTLPSSVKVGSPVKLAWQGSDGTPITITLKSGSPDNLQTVALITGSATGSSYTWTPDKSLPSGDNYALQIAQDDTDVNYTGLFAITGGSASSSSMSSSTSAAQKVAVGQGSHHSSTASSTKAASTASSSSSNSTGAATTGSAGTAAPSAGVTGSSASRNTTLSKATLSSSSRSSSSAAATTTTGEGSSSSSTSSSASASPTSAAIKIASNFGLLLAGVAAFAFVG